MRRTTSMQSGARIVGGLVVLAGIISLVAARPAGAALFSKLWGVEPLTYIGAVLLILGLGITSLSYVIPGLLGTRSTKGAGIDERWSTLTSQYFELFDHDLGRPLRRIVGKGRELRAVLRASGAVSEPAVKELLDEIEHQTPSFQLMMSNIRVLVNLDAPDWPARSQPVEPSEVVRRIVDRYGPLAAESEKQLTWWAEPAEFGIVYSESSAIEHIVTNLVDNAVRFSTSQVEVKLTRNPTHFFVRVRDDGPGIGQQYLSHIFDRGWTPQVVRGEGKSSSGLGLYIARNLAKRYVGDVTVESAAAPADDHHTELLLSLPSRGP